MGNDEIKVAVADAGQLIHLSEIGSLAILHVFDAIRVPHAVWLEIGEYRENISEKSRTAYNRPL